MLSAPRPRCCPPAGRVTLSPANITQVAQALCVSPKAAHRLLASCPELVGSNPDGDSLAAAVAALAAALGTSYKQAAYVWRQQPQYLLKHGAGAVAAHAAELAQALGLQRQAAAELLLQHPVLLQQSATRTAARLADMQGWLHLKPRQALALAVDCSEWLTQRSGALQRRLQHLRLTLLVHPNSMPRLLAARADLPFLSPRILSNKVRALMAILDGDRRTIGQLLLHTPQLLRRDLRAVASAHEALQGLLQQQGRSRGFVFAMLAHDARLLLGTPASLTARLTKLQRCAGRCERWQQELAAMKPPQLEECLTRTAVTYLRLDYLLASQQASGMGLAEALRSSRRGFVARHGAYAAWEAAVAAARQQRAQAAAGGGSSAAGTSGASHAPSGPGQAPASSLRQAPQLRPPGAGVGAAAPTAPQAPASSSEHGHAWAEGPAPATAAPAAAAVAAPAAVAAGGQQQARLRQALVLEGH
jgi:hypothetical protein